MKAIGWMAVAALAGQAAAAQRPKTQKAPQVSAAAAPDAAAGGDVKAGVDAWARGDWRAAVDAWRGPAVAGDADAQFNLGQAYKLGRGVPVDPVLAESWFRKAALQGHAQAEDNYGLALFQAGRKGEAAQWLEKGVARGEGRTQLVLGTMLFNGDGVPRDFPRAYALMTAASQKGMKSASETLAQMDQYVSPADREAGLRLAQRYAAQARVATIGTAPAPAAAPPAAVAVAATPARTAAASRPTPAPPPTPASTPRAQPAPARPAATGGWRIQLGAFSSRANAETQWRTVRARLSGVTPDYVAAGAVIRLQAGPYPTRAAATRACAASGVSCVVVAR